MRRRRHQSGNPTSGLVVHHLSSLVHFAGRQHPYSEDRSPAKCASFSDTLCFFCVVLHSTAARFSFFDKRRKRKRKRPPGRTNHRVPTRLSPQKRASRRRSRAAVRSLGFEAAFPSQTASKCGQPTKFTRTGMAGKQNIFKMPTTRGRAPDLSP